MSSNETWVKVCDVNDLVDNSGVCALVDAQQIALFKVKSQGEEQVLAISNWDPIGGANVLYRGLVCSVSGAEAPPRTVVASPLYKQRFCLTTGECLDDPQAAVSVFPARVVNGTVELSLVS